jgi:hypothetical protein
VTARLLSLLALLALLATPAWPAGSLPPGYDPLERFPQSSVTIESGERQHRFTVWVADTAAHITQGLMFVRRMPADRGMLFLFGYEDYRGFWMKNTYLSLDMLFIAADGRIVNIAEKTRPLSVDNIPSTGPALAVLELNGGTAARLGIRAGDRVLHTAFSPLRQR